MLYTTLFPDEGNCELWTEIVAYCGSHGRPTATADAWIAAIARQSGIPVVAIGCKDHEAVEDLGLIPIE